MKRIKAKAVAAGLLAGLAFGLGPAQGRAQEPPPRFVWYVLNELNRSAFDIEDPTAGPPLVSELPAGVLTPVDVTKDGVTDWLIRWPESPAFCGTGGCRHSLYVSEGGGYLRVFDRQAWDLEIAPRANEVRLEASFHHLHCSPARETCRLAWAWDPRSLGLEERPSADGAAIIPGFGEPPVDPGDRDGRPVLPADIPLAVHDRYLDGRRACPAADDPAEVHVSHPAVVSIPDVNGDRRRDWLIDAPGSCAGEDAPGYGYQVWVSDGAEDAVLAFTSAPGDWPWLQLDASPVRLRTGPDCSSAEACEAVPLVWDSAARTLRSPGPVPPGRRR